MNANTTSATLNELGKVTDLISTKSINKCLEYSEDKEALKSIINELKVNVELEGKVNPFWNDKEGKKVLKYDVTIKRKDKKIRFDFYQSIHFTEIMNRNDVFDHSILKDKKHLANNFLYSVLCCVKNDAYTPNNFEDFCSEYGYDEDSIKANNTFKACIDMKKKVLSIFSEDELQSFPS